VQLWRLALLVPLPGCARRCLILYIKHHVRCRICHGLIYESQSQHEDEREVSQLANRRQKLGGSRDLARDFPPKPKWMRWIVSITTMIRIFIRHDKSRALLLRFDIT
jgi:hypothetical protein